mmetsp:Transcript_8954/g.20328  ORF Transcript_8954/g.20328 Transcript_8954/m.20328 type:complete len:296 (+) Transcript_8954:16-903(+)
MRDLTTLQRDVVWPSERERIRSRHAVRRRRRLEGKAYHHLLFLALDGAYHLVRDLLGCLQTGSRRRKQLAHLLCVHSTLFVHSSVEEIRLDDARMHTGDVHTLWSELRAKRLGESTKRKLRRRVSTHALQRQHCTERVYEGDRRRHGCRRRSAARIRVKKHWQECARRANVSHKVALHNPLPVVLSCRAKRCCQAHAGDVHQEVKPASSRLGDRGGKRLHAFRVRYVRRDGSKYATGLEIALQGLRRLVKICCVACDDDGIVSLLTQAPTHSTSCSQAPSYDHSDRPGWHARDDG